ncbi:ComGF family competence protein [Shimazuella sp. AN120528]|nr:ComGF family competence protein [Shimazuella soli]
MILSFAIVTTLFPLFFGLFYQVFNSIHSQLATYALFTQFDRFSLQLQKDEANGVKFLIHQNQLEMIMKDGLRVRYQWKQDQIVRSVKESSSAFYRGNTILLYQVRRVYYQNLKNGVKMTVVLSQQDATFTGFSYIWGRINE